MRARPFIAASLLGIFSAHAEDPGVEFFEKHIRPVLVEHCYGCHSVESGKSKGGLLLDSRDALRRGGDSGPALDPGDPDASLLLTAIRYADKDLQMPPPKDGIVKKLPADIVAQFEAWVKIGAPDPRIAGRAPAPEKDGIDYAAARSQWPYAPPRRPALPTVKDIAWPRGEIDHFVLAKLEAAQLGPAPAADSRTLIRRMTFDLTGLPPTPEEVAAFERDSIRDPQSAVAILIDRLLASPHYGERWARHWLDVVRYTDSFDARVTTGDGQKMDCTEAWRYRDWVVNALNCDLPYDQFVQHQVAGDILSAESFDAEKIVATGVYALGNWGGGDADKEKLLTDIADDQVDLTGRAFLGLTLACARCHDHKFDPISAEDYYGLAGIFFSSHILPDPGPKTNGPNMLRIPLLPPGALEERRKLEARLAEIDAQISSVLTPLTEMKRDVAGKPGLLGRAPRGADNPSLVVNTTEAEIAFSTIRLPGRAIAVHPGPNTPVTAVWRSPIRGKVRLAATLSDVDPNCGDGIEWRLRKPGATVARGDIANGAQAVLPEQEIAVEPGDLLRLVIKPRGEYTCDSTRVECVVRAEDGRVWDLREALLAGDAHDRAGLWEICAGDSERMLGVGIDTTALKAERDQLAARLAEPAPVAHGLQEGGCPKSPHAGVHDVKVHVRGRYDRLGALVPRRFPRVLAGDAQPPVTEGSGRLALARWLADRGNPLPARVLVNRVWQHHFGEGLVRTPNNFGKLGEPPSHPELLDWLAGEFIQSGWSLKKLHRTILLSATWQQSSIPLPATLHADPENRLLGRMARRRLESEPLRDALLVAAGRIDLSAGGPATRDLNAPRRTLYLMTVRSDRTGYQSLFDAADPTGIVEKRLNSTVAPQALFLLNHPFVLAQAQALSTRVPCEPGAIDRLHRLLYARGVKPEELHLAEAALAQGVTWEQYCHTLLCANEFVYLD